MSTYHDDSTMASDPGNVGLSKEKLDVFKKQIGWFLRFLLGRRCPDAYIAEHLQLGDSRAAVVIQTAPLLVVAAYTDELDCVALLEFPSEFTGQYGLDIGSRLLTVNTYDSGEDIAADLTAGPLNTSRYVNFYPIVAEFLSDDITRIEKRKKKIEEEEWAKAEQMGKEALARGVNPRNGSPYFSQFPDE